MTDQERDHKRAVLHEQAFRRHDDAAAANILAATTGKEIDHDAAMVATAKADEATLEAVSETGVVTDAITPALQAEAESELAMEACSDANDPDEEDPKGCHAEAATHHRRAAAYHREASAKLQ